MKKASYTVRSRHLKAGEPIYTNRLILEDSPYLLQHAHNPVNWYAWGDEAFAAARKQNKPVFLSIGYSTCHWCHVMEEESFDDEAVAAILNRDFISIKVDREQRPDLDEIYMMGVQLMTGSGGWPMSNFLTADSMPFHGGTYYPKEDFIQLLQHVHQVWKDDPLSLKNGASKIYKAIEHQLNSRGQAASIGQQHIDEALTQLLSTEDRRHGGRTGAPKFPNEASLLLLLGQIERSDEPITTNPYWQTLYRALDGMLRGGIYDQVAGGFHRYSTDAKWLVPHFEKMLYNQAQLSRLYARAWKLSGDKEFRRIADETLDYVLREMRSKNGAFYSATDADSEDEEGKYFVWHYSELEKRLNDKQLTLMETVYGVTWEGNFDNANLLYLPKPLNQVASQLKLDRTTLLQQLGVIKQTLLSIRQQRIPPLRDDKIITEWNGMMITALAEAGYLLDEPKYIAAAVKAAEFIWQHNRNEQGLLYRIHLNGRSTTQATLADYSFYLEAMLALYDASGNRKWLSRASTLQQQMTELFWEKNGGGFYISQTSTTGPMIMRSQSSSDGATASGNSVALVALVSLKQRATSFALQSQIEQQINHFSPRLNNSPLALSYMLTGIDEYLHPRPHLVQYAGGGHVRMVATLQQSELKANQLSVELAIEKGWHINANNIGDAKLIATELTLDNGRVKAIHYPKAIEKTVAFTDSPLALYQGRVKIVAELQKDAVHSKAATPIIASIRLQACSESVCLPPETLRMILRNQTL
ncbi:MAG: thioredoxin domain-containing protein [Gammaproteobacteria bacterium]